MEMHKHTAHAYSDPLLVATKGKDEARNNREHSRKTSLRL